MARVPTALPTLRAGQVLVTEGKRSSLVSQLVARHTGSWATHAVQVLGPRIGVEAVVPRVRRIDVAARLAKLQREDRAVAVLDLPELTLAQRLTVAQQANQFVGRWYDIGQVLLYAATKQFWRDGTGTLVCSRLVTGSVYETAGTLFPPPVLAARFDPDAERLKLDNLRRGYATPDDLLRSRLVCVAFLPSSRIRALDDFLPASARPVASSVPSF